jgi:serine/threonine-protein kinase RsbW
MTETIGPTKSAPRLRLDARAIRASAPLFSSAVQAFLVDGLGCNASDPETAHVRLAITEAITNVIRHGFDGGAPGRVSLELRLEETEFVAVVSDDGKRFNPHDSQQPKLPRPEELREGGYGLGILFEVMDGIEHAWEDGNRLTMRKRLGATQRRVADA